VSEWFKEQAWKVCIQDTVSGVRIPSPPRRKRINRKCCFVAEQTSDNSYLIFFIINGTGFFLLYSLLMKNEFSKADGSLNWKNFMRIGYEKKMKERINALNHLMKNYAEIVHDKTLHHRLH
jgi:hypothetical protein